MMTTYGRLIRYRCPIKSCTEEPKIYFVHDTRVPPAPWCFGPITRNHRRAQVAILDAEMPITDQLPWIRPAAPAAQAEEGGAR